MSKSYKNLRAALDAKCPYCNKFLDINHAASTHKIDVNSNFAIIYTKQNQYSSISLSKDSLDPGVEKSLMEVAVFYLECKKHHYATDITVCFNFADKNTFTIESFECLTLIPDVSLVYTFLNCFRTNTTRINVFDSSVFPVNLDLSTDILISLKTQDDRVKIPIIPITNDIDYLLRTAKVLTTF